ncbi:uncharacterized protein si:ch211-13c6.2 [Brachionichthys hirsutus]|uniref:uncharacterized protein si:ch211-13c6.2 n=1 Tax=Brachionichthys hirsutus TaxID=412623 RepID=UPI0036053E00
MVYHVIGRKHRQNYMEAKRPDLVTWDKQNIINQAGKIIRARSEMIERQDGRGSPVLMKKSGMMGRCNNSGVPPWQDQYSDRNIPPSFTKFDGNETETSHIPLLMNFHQVRSSLLAEEPHVARDQQTRREEDAPGYVHATQSRSEYKESEKQTQDYMDPDHHRTYDEEPQRRVVLEPGGASRYNSSPARREECYPKGAPAYTRAYPERGPAQYRPPQPLYQGSDNPRRSLERESGRHDGLKRAAMRGSSEPESKRRSFLSPMASDALSDHFIHIRDYGHKGTSPRREEVVGPSREGQMDVTRSVSDIPEPFRHFLEGASRGEGFAKGRRKSRFSDATAEEVKSAKDMFSDGFEPPNSKVRNYPRPFDEALSPEIRGIQHPDIYSESHGPNHSESYQRGVSESEDVFDILKNVEIENAEEAGFLKNKLCDLLKEFKAKKSEKAAQNIKDYNNMGPASDLPLRQQYEMTLREDMDFRRPEGLSFQENHRKRAWTPEEQIPDKRLQEFHRPAHEESREPKSNRSCFAAIFGRSEMSPPSPRPDEPLHFPERFQESMHSRPMEGFLDSRISSSPLNMERRSRWDGGPGRSNSLDKITSTLLELVSRK